MISQNTGTRYDEGARTARKAGRNNNERVSLIMSMLEVSKEQPDAAALAEEGSSSDGEFFDSVAGREFSSATDGETAWAG